MSDRTAYRTGIAALACSILASALAQLLLKTGVSLSAGALHPGGPGFWLVVAGLGAYGISLLAWLAVLARVPLSFAYPLLSLSYVLVYIGAVASPQLSEAVTPLRVTGVLLVACGAALVSATGRARDRSRLPAQRRS